MINQRLLRSSALLAVLLTPLLSGTVDAKSHREQRQDEAAVARPTGPPLLAIVALREQRVTIYDAEGRILHAPVSTGQTGYETPAGIYSVIGKEVEHYSNLYDDASMPFMQRITWSGIALHAGVLPGYPASHGCIRMPHGFAEQLFGLTKLGLRVVIVPRDISPIEFSHPLLFKPRAPIVSVDATAEKIAGVAKPSPMLLGAALDPSNAPKRNPTLRMIAAAKSAEAEAATKHSEEVRRAATKIISEAARYTRAVRIAENTRHRAELRLKSAENALQAAHSPAATQNAEEAKAKGQAELTAAETQLERAKADGQPQIEAAQRAREEVSAAEAAKVAAIAAAKEAERKTAPVSVFISRKTQRLYVRQAFQPVFESDVTIRDSDKPVGTYVFTATSYSNDEEDVKWNALAMYSDEARLEPSSGGKRRHAEHAAEPIATHADAAKAALDRIAIPPDAIQRISEVISPGSSLIVSDEGLSRETGKGTDFVVLMSGEPQGGIKIRRRDPMAQYRYPRAFPRQFYGRGFSWW